MSMFYADTPPDNDGGPPFRPCMFCVAEDRPELRPATGWRLTFPGWPARLQTWVEACSSHARPVALAV